MYRIQQLVATGPHNQPEWFPLPYVRDIVEQKFIINESSKIIYTGAIMYIVALKFSNDIDLKLLDK